MNCFISTRDDPFFNLATEEFLLKNSTEEYFILYINAPCVVVGKHQNLLSEINLPYILEHDIKLSRRISGGGTVYQDHNNINFSFIHNCSQIEQITYTRFVTPVLAALKEMGLKVEFSERHDIIIEEKKISGNAMHVFKNRVLSHGTLLFNANLTNLSNSLRVVEQKYTDNSVKSVRSKVANISEYLPQSLTIGLFSEILFTKISGYFSPTKKIELSKKETDQIEELVKVKFSTWEWIYGYSPNYTFNASVTLNEEKFSLAIKVEKGIIKKIESSVDTKNHAILHDIIGLLIEEKHDLQRIFKKLSEDQKVKQSSEIDILTFCQSLF